MKTQLMELWREVFDAADRALEMEPAERERFLDRCLEEHPKIGAELKALIDAAAAESTLETPAAEFAAPFLHDVVLDDQPTANGDNHGAESIFGPYRVRREIGSGGMGAVYLAERSDDQYRKDVALKVLPRWTGGDRRKLQRFLEERQILATLDHPGIARLLDGGVTANGQPWFAMEYIDGQPIDKYCDELRLSVEERLKLFCVVCSAVQYAHRNLVVHRDLKPSNILVSADGRVALLDFGIAKLLAEDATMANAAKTIGDRLMTPLYASPEQIRGEPASTSADVYALGVLLHVLLTGGRPYRLSTFESYEVARAVLEQEPERPSVSAANESKSVGAGATEQPAANRALSRASTSIKLVRRLRGDLDAIVLKAMAKDPSRRYATVEQLETDVRRHLTGLPVLAQPESRSYLVRKFIRRHRAGVAMASAAAVLVLSFAALMTVQRSRIRAQADRIALERDRAEQVGQNFLNIFRTVAPGHSGITARDILDSASASIDQQMIAHPEQRARLMFEMAGAYHRLELHDRASSLLETSLALRRNLRPKPDLDIAETLNLLGAVLLKQGNVARADAVYNEALVLRRKEPGLHADVSRTLIGLSAVRRAQRRLPEAERLSREAVAIDRSRGRDGRTDLARSTSALAAVIDDNGDHRAAATLFRVALTLVRETHPEEHPEVASTLFDLAAALHNAGENVAADSLIRYGIALNRRLLTAGLLSGTASVPSTPTSDAIETVNQTVRRALAERPAAPKEDPGSAGGSSSQIAFTTDRDEPDATGNFGNEEIYVMNADGTNQRRLTRHKARDSGAAISPDGRMIAFQSQRGGGIDIFVMNIDGSHPRQLTDFTKLGLGAVEPAWSPDGKRIAFRSRVNRIDIYVINLDGTGLEKLTADSSAVSGPPDWSPDGRRIAYTSRRHGRPEIYVMNSDGSHPIRLTLNDALDARPAWSPDGRSIAFNSTRDGDEEVYVMNADGTNQVRLTANPGEDGYPSWSPDGRQIVFHRRVLGHAQVYVMNADGSNVKRLTELSPIAFSGFPNWGRAPR